MPVLHLNVKKEWFSMIENEIKLEEYREIKPYWSRIFKNGTIKIKGKYYHATDVLICFSNGYKKDRPQVWCSCKGLKVDFGKQKWGATHNIQYYVLSIETLPF